MARARNIKPAFFKNEGLGSVSREARLLFIGLWTLADREGRLEDRPARIAAELFPYDRDITIGQVDEWLQSLADPSGDFLVRYSVGAGKYLKITNFKKHQTPHHKEKPSEIPDFHKSPGQAPTLIGQAPTQARASTDPGTCLPPLNPESGILNPDVLNPDVTEPGAEAAPAPPATPTKLIEFSNDPSDDFDALYREHPITGKKREARMAYQQILASAIDQQAVNTAIVRSHREWSAHWNGPGLPEWKPNFLQFFEDEYYLRRPREPTQKHHPQASKLSVLDNLQPREY